MLALSALVLLCAGSPASASAASDLDTAKIRALYLDGDFDAGIARLEKARMATHGDSVFVFKHLGVMFAAKQETREKGKYYMYQLLSVEPTARILDMYASDMIYMIFKNVKEEFEATRGRTAQAVPPAQAGPQAQPAGPSNPSGRRFWTAKTIAAVSVLTAAAAVGAGVAWHMAEEPETVRRSHSPD